MVGGSTSKLSSSCGSMRGSRRPLPAYLHLLPAIRVADTIGMRGDGIARALPLGGFRRLVQMSWVVARNRP